MFVRTLFIAALALSVLLVACGGDDDDSTSTGPTSSTTTSGGAPSTGGGSGSGSGGDGAATFAGFCGDWGKLGAEASKVTSGFANPGGDLKTSVEQANNFFKTVADKAPAEVKADFQVYAQVWTTMATALQRANYDFARFVSDPESQKALQALSDPKVQQATKNIEAWTLKNCTAPR